MPDSTPWLNQAIAAYCIRENRTGSVHFGLKAVWGQAGYESDLFLPAPAAIAGRGLAFVAVALADALEQWKERMCSKRSWARCCQWALQNQPPKA